MVAPLIVTERLTLGIADFVRMVSSAFDIVSSDSRDYWSIQV